MLLHHIAGQQTKLQCKGACPIISCLTLLCRSDGDVPASGGAGASGRLARCQTSSYSTKDAITLEDLQVVFGTFAVNRRSRVCRKASRPGDVMTLKGM